MEKLYRLCLRPLKRVPPDNGTEPAAGANSARLLKDMLILALGPSGENHDPAPIKRTLHHMLNPLR